MQNFDEQLLAAIRTVTALISKSLDLKTTLEQALDVVLQIIPVEAAGINLIDEKAGELVLRAQRGWEHDFLSNPIRVKLGKELSEKVLKMDSIIVSHDLNIDPQLIVSDSIKEKIQAMALAPMHSQGHLIGITSVISHKPYQFSKGQLTFLQIIADQLGVAIDHARLFEDIRARKSHLTAVIDSTADAIIAVDSNGIISLANNTAQQMFDAMTNKYWGDIASHPRLREDVLKVIKDPHKHSAFFEVMLEGERYYSVAITPVHSPEQFLESPPGDGWVIVIQDISHLRDSERNRLRFIQTAAHDLRNPLSVVQSALSHLQLNPADSNELATMGLASVAQMQSLIDDLLHLELIQSGVEMNLKTVDVRDLLERVMLEVQLLLRHKKQHFQMEVPAYLPDVKGDSRWLSRAIVNLLSNANKYTPTEGKIFLRSWHDQQHNEIVIEVEDNGIGISPGSRQRVFEMFYRDPKIKDGIPGTGIGLSIVKSIAEQHGGRVYLHSEENIGSTFGLVLPVISENEHG